MSEQNPTKPNNSPATKEAAVRTLSCEDWEALLADLQDNALAAADSPSFEAHAETCANCKEMLSRARQGREWLQFLAPPPVSPELVSKILARTSGLAIAAPNPAFPIAPSVPRQSWRISTLPVAMRRMAEPRLMMTAAMAFFSVALTLNLAGVRLTGIRLADLNPNQMRSNLTRQFINSKVGVENYCYNLKIVYEMEARVRELKRSNDAEENQPPAQHQAPVTVPNGSAHKSGKSENQRTPEPRAALWGHSVEALLQSAPVRRPGHRQTETQPAGELAGITPQSCVRPVIDRAEGSLV